MEKQIVKIQEIKFNTNNPRIIKDEKFKKLVNSITEFPQMLMLRPIVVNKDMVVLGGNMRLKACIEAGFKELPIIVANDLTEEQEKEFIIKDNVAFGEWDWDILANEWDAEQLKEWSLEVWQQEEINLDNFFEDNNNEKEEKNTINLKYTAEEYKKVIEAFNKHSGTKEAIVFKLLGL